MFYFRNKFSSYYVHLLQCIHFYGSNGWFFKKDVMSSFVRKVSFFIISLFLLNIFFFSFHFASVKHYWNNDFHRFEHCHDDEDDFSLLFDGAAFSFIKESHHHNSDIDDCGVIKFIFSYFPLVALFLFSIFKCGFSNVLPGFFKRYFYRALILYFAPKNSPPFSFHYGF